MQDIHIGPIIKQKLNEKSMTIAEFADRINCERTAVYHIFKQKSMDTERLLKISEVLEYDFINEIYLKKEAEKSQPKQTVIVAVEVDTDSLKKLNLPDEFMQLITVKNKS